MSLPYDQGGVIPRGGNSDPIPMIAEGLRLMLEGSSEMREAFRKFIETSIDLIEWLEGAPRRSAMHTAYRHKTRRRNRRRRHA